MAAVPSLLAAPRHSEPNRLPASPSLVSHRLTWSYGPSRGVCTAWCTGLCGLFRANGAWNSSGPGMFSPKCRLQRPARRGSPSLTRPTVAREGRGTGRETGRVQIALEKKLLPAWRKRRNAPPRSRSRPAQAVPTCSPASATHSTPADHVPARPACSSSGPSKHRHARRHAGVYPSPQTSPCSTGVGRVSVFLHLFFPQ